MPSATQHSCYNGGNAVIFCQYHLIPGICLTDFGPCLSPSFSCKPNFLWKRTLTLGFFNLREDFGSSLPVLEVQGFKRSLASISMDCTAF
jgi:hypothetical protein